MAGRRLTYNEMLSYGFKYGEPWAEQRRELESQLNAYANSSVNRAASAHARGQASLNPAEHAPSYNSSRGARTPGDLAHAVVGGRSGRSSSQWPASSGRQHSQSSIPSRPSSVTPSVASDRTYSYSEHISPTPSLYSYPSYASSRSSPSYATSCSSYAPSVAHSSRDASPSSLTYPDGYSYAEDDSDYDSVQSPVQSVTPAYETEEFFVTGVQLEYVDDPEEGFGARGDDIEGYLSEEGEGDDGGEYDEGGEYYDEGVYEDEGDYDEGGDYDDGGDFDEDYGEDGAYDDEW